MPDATRTNDRNVIVETYQRGRVVYRDIITGERWAELGECNQCGLCVDANDPTVEWTGTPIGDPGAVRDLNYETRPLYVTRPAWKASEPRCSLSFEVLDGD